MTKKQAEDVKFAARDMLMSGMQVAIYNCDDKVIRQPKMVAEFRRIEKFLGYQPGYWDTHSQEEVE
jgi:hypothetical protein